MRQSIKNGIYPTMIVPYTRDNELDENALRLMVRWYHKKGCHGIFAACQSSEIFYLSAKERKAMVEIVKDEVSKIGTQSGEEPMTVVASGHISNSTEAQAEELIMMQEAGADAVVLISNRLDTPNTGDSAWIRDLERLIDRLPDTMRLGIYECPSPYKRLLSDKMLEAIASTGRFYFFKDTCCNPARLKRRLEILRGSNVRLFNANAQTFLSSLQDGGSGYCGIMANFHPELYVWLYERYSRDPGAAAELENLLSMAAFTEVLAYPVTAKYYLKSFEHIPMELSSRSCAQPLREYDRFVMEQLHQLKHFCRQVFLDQPNRQEDSHEK